MFTQQLQLLRLVALGALMISLAACKYQSEGSPAPSTPSPPSAPAAPSVPATPTAFARDAAPQVSTSGPLTLERYADTTTAVGGTSMSAQNALIHQEAKP